jgi:glycosyltransferase involved in cell wall biosynthesis
MRGTELYIREVFSRMVGEGHQVYMVCGTPEAGLPKSENIDGIQIHYFNTYIPGLMRSETLRFFLSRYMFYLFSFPKIHAVAKRLEVDAIYEFISPAPSGAPIVARILGIPCVGRVWEYFGRDWFSNRGLVTACIGYLAEKIVPRLPYTLYSTSSRDMFTRMVEKGRYPLDRMRFVPEGVDLTRFTPNDPDLSERLLSPTVIHIGGFTPQKGHSYLLDAIPQIVDRHRQIKFQFVGTGQLLERCRKQANQLGVTPYVEFLGRVDDAELLRLLQNATIHVVSSLQECIPLTALEAMACGVPVVVTDAPGVGEIVQDEHDGLVVRTRDSDALAHGINRLLDDTQLYCSVRHNALATVRRYDWSNVVREEEKKLLEAISCFTQRST